MHDSTCNWSCIKSQKTHETSGAPEMTYACSASRPAAFCNITRLSMVMQARGLDAGDRLVQRLRSSGDARSAAIVQQIALEERAHVAVGKKMIY